MKEMNLKAEIIRLKTELEDRCLVLEKAEAELAELKAEREGLQMTIRSLRMRGDDAE